MCGIVGIFHADGRKVDRRLLRVMNDAHSHRGPDGEGEFVAAGIGLGHRRLSIIDLEGGRQPMFNEDESVVVVFNGEIYNFGELADELAARGHVFRSRCDTEVIVHGWEAWKEACVDRFRGMFAFALWDLRAQRLFLARDRLGIKPLHYSLLADGTLVFGSELKSLLRHPGVARELDATAVEDYFAYGYIPDPKTIYRSVAKLPPAHTLSLCRGGEPVRRAYWDVSFREKHDHAEPELRGELIERLREAVRLRLIADVPLGAFLSGGVDSSAVVALMAGLSAGPVETCSIAFDHAAFNEVEYAAMVAERFGARHHVGRVEAAAFDLVGTLVDVYDEPFADSSALPTYQVCGLGRRHVTVALSGDGGDEVFAGYRRYRWHHYEERIRGLLPQAIRGPLFATLGRLYPKLDWAPRPLRAKATLQALARDTVAGYFHSVSLLPDTWRRQLYTGDMCRSLADYDPKSVLADHMRRAPADHYLDRVQYADMKTYLAGDILTKVDRASMAHGLEVRVPLLDHKFVEWSAGLPASLKLRNGDGKHIFKRALEPLLPGEVLYRPKMGFAVPLVAWFRGGLQGELSRLSTSRDLAATGMIDLDFVARLGREHAAGIRDHSAALWALVMFEGFLRQVHPARPSVAAADELNGDQTIRTYAAG